MSALAGQEPSLPPCHAPHLTHLLTQLAFLWRMFLSLSFMCPLLFLGTGEGFSVLRRTRQLPAPPVTDGGASRSAPPPILPTPPPHPPKLSQARTHSGAEPVSSSVQTRSQAMCKRRTGVRGGSCAARTAHVGRQSNPGTCTLKMSYGISPRVSGSPACSPCLPAGGHAGAFTWLGRLRFPELHQVVMGLLGPGPWTQAADVRGS